MSQPLNLRVIPMGGVGEIGKNMTLVEYDERILIIDAGLMFPENDMLGVDILIPDMSYVLEHREQVCGVIVTHGHEDHTGALPFVLKQLNRPVYGSRFTLALIKSKLDEHGLIRSVEIDGARVAVIERAAVTKPFCQLVRFKRYSDDPDLVAKLKQQLNLAALFVTHDLQEAFALADQIAIYDQGKVLQFGPREQILNEAMQTVETAQRDFRRGLLTEEERGDFAVRGKKGREKRIITSLFLKEPELEALNHRLQAKLQTIREAEQRWETYQMEDAEYLLVAYGSVARTCKTVIRDAQGEGLRAGLFRPISLWPFPYEHLAKAAEGKRAILTVEMSAGQMLEDVQIAVRGSLPVEFYGRMGGVMPLPDEVLEALRGVAFTHRPLQTGVESRYW